MNWNFFVTIILVCNVGQCLTNNETKVMQHISETIGDYVLECKKEMSFNAKIIDVFLSYWDETKALQDHSMGCVVNCVLDKLHLIKPGGELELANAEAFTKANGSDERISKGLIELYQMCKKIITVKEPCEFALGISRCFRAGVMMLKWAPDLNEYEMDYTQDEQ